MKRKNQTILNWPAKCSDLNSLEDIQSQLQAAIGERNPSKVSELEEIAKEVLQKIPGEKYQILIYAYQKRLKTWSSLPKCVQPDIKKGQLYY